ncbi:hypothetical protein [Aliivibrio kagoshimensis]|uniref:hypothetical protein n=1 Tax=Aliivibrio kagoshimensis TaxID=2910230 RepID=UPI003D11131B
MNIEELKLEQEHDRLRELESQMDEVHKFIAYCESKGIKLTKGDFNFSYQTGLVAKSNGLVQSLFPDLGLDKDKLIDFYALKNGGQYDVEEFGYVFGPEFGLLASPYFRRSYNDTANWEPSFLSALWRYENSEASCYLALDLDRVRLPNDTSVYGEKDYWYGPYFDGDISSIKDGVTRHVTPLETSDLQKSFVFNNAYSIEVKWDTEGNKRSFQLIEFRDETITLDTGISKLHPARYLHAEFDVNKNEFTHFDGAIQLFEESDYYKVRDQFFGYGKNSTSQVKAQYLKLFKINDSLSIDDWVEFVGLFCTKDPLITEYFTGSYSKHVSEILRKTENIRI